MNKFFLLLVVFTQVSGIFACRCRVPVLEETYLSSETDRFVAAKPIFKTTVDQFRQLVIFRVRKVYKGCPVKYFAASTSTSSASCGVNFNIGHLYVMPLPTLTLNIRVNSCQVCNSSTGLSAWVSSGTFFYY